MHLTSITECDIMGIEKGVSGMKFAEVLKAERKRRRISQVDLARRCNVSQGTIANWEAGTRTPDLETIAKLAAILGITVDHLLGRAAPSSNISAVYSDNIRMIPVFESVSAGFGARADDHIIDFCPFMIASEHEAAETIAIRVSGDSMSPKIEDGDIIRVRKQESVDSGSIAVVLLDGEEGLVKKVVYGDTWIELHSVNPYYPVRRFDGEEVLRIRVVGLVKGVFREF